MSLAGRLVDVSSGFCNPVMLKVSPVTAHRIAMNGANVVVSSHHRAGKTFQNDAESSRCDVEAAGLEPDTICIRNPETVIIQVGVSDEVFPAPSIRIETVGEITEGGDRHMSPFVCQLLWLSRPACTASAARTPFSREPLAPTPADRNSRYRRRPATSRPLACPTPRGLRRGPSPPLPRRPS